MGARALAVLSRAAERRSTHRRVRGVSSPGAAHDEDRGRVGAAQRAALRALARRPSIAGLARPYVARTHLHPAHRRGARRHAGARARARDDRCAPWRRRARDPLVPCHARRPAPPSRLRGARLHRDQRRHRVERAAGATRQGARRHRVRRHAELLRELARLGAHSRSRSAPRSALPDRLLDRAGVDAGAAQRAGGGFRCGALRSLRRGVDRSAGGGMPRTPGHASTPRRALPGVPRSRERPAGRARRDRGGGGDPSRPPRDAASSLCSRRCLPPARGRLPVRRSEPACRVRRAGRGGPQGEGSARASRASGAAARRVSRGRALPDRRRSAAGPTLRARHTAHRPA